MTAHKKVRRVWGMMLLALVLPLAARAQANDGFQRRDGTMYLVRNGEIRPMPHDVHLPNGRLVTRDGFVVQRDGRRTELRDGQGCTLLGETTTVNRSASGRLQLATAGGPPAPGAQAGPSLPGWARGWAKGRGHGKGHGKHKGRKHRD